MILICNIDSHLKHLLLLQPPPRLESSGFHLSDTPHSTFLKLVGLSREILGTAI